METRTISADTLEGFAAHLAETERSGSTRSYYIRVARQFTAFAGGRPVTKQLVIDFKDRLTGSGKYSASTVNTYLSALGSYLEYAGMRELKARHIRVQKRVYASSGEELSKREYERMLLGTEPGSRMRMVLETLAGSGIRVSELRSFTVEAVRRESFTVTNKGKTRDVILIPKLRKKLLSYAEKNGIRSGPIFRTKSGKPLGRSYIWAEMKKLAARSGVPPEKVFPHNLRKLFAREFYEIKKDIAKLADVLGHSNINTTRIYLLTSAKEHCRGMARMGLVT